MPDGVKPTQEQRLAAKLRENLKRRKEQARARAAVAPVGTATAGKPPSDSEQSIAAPDRVALKPAADSDS
jgi:hypothetical protein